MTLDGRKETPSADRTAENRALIVPGQGVTGRSERVGVDNATRTPMNGTKHAERLEWMREISTAVIAVTIVALTAVLVIGTFVTTDDKAFPLKKDVMLYGVTLLGTVLGYYFGRGPAEAQAARAQEETTAQRKTIEQIQQRAAISTQATAEQLGYAEARQVEAQKRAARVREAVRNARDLLEPAAAATISIPDGSLDPQATRVDRARAVLDGALSQENS